MFSLTKRLFSQPVGDTKKYTQAISRFYTVLAPFYNGFMYLVPVWKSWLRRALPHIQGPKVLEVSFGPAYLLTKYADRYETHGIDYNERMVALARKKLARRNISAALRQGNVEALPYPDESFDTVVNTMAFSAYPDADQAMSELHRVLKKGGKLILIDANYPKNGNWLGIVLTNIWKYTGDLIRDMDALLERFGVAYSDEEIGACGSIHLYVATKN